VLEESLQLHLTPLSAGITPRQRGTDLLRDLLQRPVLIPHSAQLLGECSIATAASFVELLSPQIHRFESLCNRCHDVIHPLLASAVDQMKGAGRGHKAKDETKPNKTNHAADFHKVTVPGPPDIPAPVPPGQRDRLSAPEPREGGHEYR
jgi:hypothetical protein